jgi:hypothetical protein
MEEKVPHGIPPLRIEVNATTDPLEETSLDCTGEQDWQLIILLECRPQI